MKRLRAVLLDFGGVLAEEGFAEGLRAIAAANGLPGEDFVRKGHDLVHETGYVTGHVLEKTYWDVLRAETGISGSDASLRREILSRFVFRDWMADLLPALREGIPLLGILSDQTNWLDELDGRDRFFRRFDRVFNSFYIGKSKRNPALFDHVLEILGVAGEEVLFVDDNDGNCERADARGIRTIRYTGREAFLSRIRREVSFLR
ncbi:MAG TPA: HAD family phosphatase [Syntrophales bacterium]|nr:HAD family phosphatase [Syntrophales bacterium]